MSIKEKVNHVITAPFSSGHLCHWPGCDKQIKPAFCMCPSHWYQVPINLRNRIWKEYQLGQEIFKTPSANYIQVMKEILEWIANYKKEQGK